MSFCEALGLAFIVLKLCSVIDWSWWWVLMPIIVVCLARIIDEKLKDEKLKNERN